MEILERCIFGHLKKLKKESFPVKFEEFFNVKIWFQFIAVKFTVDFFWIGKR